MGRAPQDPPLLTRRTSRRAGVAEDGGQLGAGSGLRCLSNSPGRRRPRGWQVVVSPQRWLVASRVSVGDYSRAEAALSPWLLGRYAFRGRARPGLRDRRLSPRSRSRRPRLLCTGDRAVERTRLPACHRSRHWQYRPPRRGGRRAMVPSTVRETWDRRARGRGGLGDLADCGHRLSHRAARLIEAGGVRLLLGGPGRRPRVQASRTRQSPPQTARPSAAVVTVRRSAGGPTRSSRCCGRSP